MDVAKINKSIDKKDKSSKVKQKNISPQPFKGDPELEKKFREKNEMLREYANNIMLLNRAMIEGYNSTFNDSSSMEQNFLKKYEAYNDDQLEMEMNILEEKMYQLTMS